MLIYLVDCLGPRHVRRCCSRQNIGISITVSNELALESIYVCMYGYKHTHKTQVKRIAKLGLRALPRMPMLRGTWHPYKNE